ncbi:MAG: hypothetical protein Hyperionvirus4_19 [Hyperionvirus sp.]|uniref:Uncharacterized protein n=1 Tax=Hyperionvirus sp. TaxID=2487770 RepID=A0A3G5A991_9VIRU|nr:MAG: hypothetical protein Hyperionvirus4_19 [Hyperionvirus sp.]
MAGARRISTEKRASIIAQHNIDTEIFKEKLKPQVSSDIDEKKIWELQSKYSDCQLQVKLAEAEDIALKTADSNKKLHQADKDLAAAFEQINKFLDQIEARASAERMKQWNCYNLVKDAERDTKPHNPRRGGWK